MTTPNEELRARLPELPKGVAPVHVYDASVGNKWAPPCTDYYTADQMRDYAIAALARQEEGREAVNPERVAQLIAHRACCGTEHDPANGKLHGYCVVCGVDWPCEYAGKPPTPPSAGEGGDRREPAPPHSLPSWGECQLRVNNSDYVAKRKAEGGYGEDPDGKYAKALHRFIYEYDDADPYKSAWFLHRLEQVLIEARATPAPHSGGEVLLVDRGALTLALNVLRRAGKDEVADALSEGVATPTPQASADGVDATAVEQFKSAHEAGMCAYELRELSAGRAPRLQDSLDAGIAAGIAAFTAKLTTAGQQAAGVSEEMVDQAEEAYADAIERENEAERLPLMGRMHVAMRAAIEAVWPTAAGAAPEGLAGELVEMGDDDEGQPRLVIHTTREAIKASNLRMFRSVGVRMLAAAQQPGAQGVANG